MTDDRDEARRKMWDAVNQITESSSRKVDRDTDAEWVAALADDPTITVCDVAAYRAATVAYGKIPSLWQQATWALTTGSEQAEGGSSPLRERSPADLDLMETMLTIRESMAWQLKARGLKPHAKGGMPAHMRQLAAHVAGHEPAHVEWWAYRFGQWARLLATHLRALDSGPKPRRLRAACPLCKTRQITVDMDGTVGPPIVVDFVNGWIRAARCQCCGATWFRGDQLGELAALLDTPPDTVVANSA